jgi:hypothetical protein
VACAALLHDTVEDHAAELAPGTTEAKLAARLKKVRERLAARRRQPAVSGRTTDSRKLSASSRRCVDRYFIDMAYYAIGAKPLELTQLRHDLREWLAAVVSLRPPRPNSHKNALERDATLVSKN